MKTLKAVLLLSLMPILFVGCVAWNVSIWNECRTDHSWGYCMMLMKNR